MLNPLDAIADSLKIAIIVSICAIAGFTAYHYKLNNDSLKEEVKTLEVRADAYKQGIAALQGAIQRQNSAIQEAKDAQVAAEAKSAQEIEKARKAAQEAIKRAGTIISTPKPEGVDACVAATNLFDGVVHESK